MNFTNVTDSYPYNMLRASNSFARCETGVVIDSEPHLSRMCKTSLLVAPLAVRVQAGCYAFSILLSDKTVYTIKFEIQNCFNFFSYFRYL